MAECLGLVELLRKVIECVATDVRRGCAQSVAVEYLPQGCGGHVEVLHRSEQLDVLVSGSGDIGDGALEVAASVIAKTVKLDPDAAELSGARQLICGAPDLGEHGCRAEGGDEFAAVHVRYRLGLLSSNKELTTKAFDTEGRSSRRATEKS